MECLHPRCDCCPVHSVLCTSALAVLSQSHPRFLLMLLHPSAIPAWPLFPTDPLCWELLQSLFLGAGQERCCCSWQVFRQFPAGRTLRLGCVHTKVQ